VSLICYRVSIPRRSSKGEKSQKETKQKQLGCRRSVEPRRRRHLQTNREKNNKIGWIPIILSPASILNIGRGEGGGRDRLRNIETLLRVAGVADVSAAWR